MNLPTKVGEGAAAEVFTSSAHPDRVLKVLKCSANPIILCRECAWMALASSLGVPTPIAYGISTWANKTGLEMSLASGDTWLGQLDKPTLVRPEEYGRALAEIHRALHKNAVQHNQIPSNAALGPQLANFHQRRTVQLKRLESTHQIATTALQMLKNLPEGSNLCHGDLHLANVMGALNSPIVIDWDLAGVAASECDVATTVLRLILLEKCPDESESFQSAVQSARRAYLETYPLAQGSPLDRNVLNTWTRVHATSMIQNPNPILQQVATGALDPFA